MKQIVMALALLVAGTTGFAQVKSHHHSKMHHHGMMAQKYTCSMHPEVVMNKPGKCPKCGMALIPMKSKKMKMDKKMDDMKM